VCVFAVSVLRVRLRGELSGAQFYFRPLDMLITTTDSAALNWFCLRAQAKREHIAASNLRERVAIEVFAPRIRRMLNTRHGLVMNATEALFPGYLFARFAYRDQTRHVISTCGVTGIVAFGGTPPAIADGVIAHLRAEVAVAERADVAPILEEGSWVRILSGCLQFIEGRVLQFDPRTERVRLLLSLLGSDVRVTLATDQVTLLSESRPLYPSGLIVAHVENSIHEPCVA
jgi:transcriptional antiterminator RfaH